MNDIENVIEAEIVETPEPEQMHLKETLEEVDELTLLKSELASLREELKIRDERDRANSKILKELEEFGTYFPDVDISEIPSEIWEQVRCGASLSAQFALFLRKAELERKKVSDFNEKNRRMSAGSLIQGEGEKFYSPSEVKKMSPAEVKTHYDEIVESMRHWN